MSTPARSTAPLDFDAILDTLRALVPDAQSMDPDALAEIVAYVLSEVPDPVVYAVLSQMTGAAPNLPRSVLDQAAEIDPGYRRLPHLMHLSDRLTRAVSDVEGGTSRFVRVSMPPRSGKSTLTSLYLPTWLLRCHPDWKIGMISYGSNFATSWGRNVRRLFDSRDLGVAIAPDLSAASDWETTSHGSMLSRGINGDITGRGFKVLLLDDLVKGFAEAHSETLRDAVWDRWTSDLYSRLEPPFLVVAIGTRWHEDDFLGRLASDEYEGDPAQWEVIEFPAIAEDALDVLGRAPGEPLLSPLVDETPAQALVRWETIRLSVGSYAWNALYQQHPAPSKGAIFDIGTFRYWTHNPANATADDRVRWLDPSALLGAQWADSWDCAFKGTNESDWVVGQRWVRHYGNRYLIAQQRGRWSFTQTIKQMEQWGKAHTTHDPTLSPYGHLVHVRLIEDKANGPAIIDTLHDKIAGLKAVNPNTSKEARARAVTPEIESGNVYLPYPGDPGNEWVGDLLAELRDFPHAAHDDQVDSLTQALSHLRDIMPGMVTVPGGQIDRNTAAAAHSDLNRPGRSERAQRRELSPLARKIIRSVGR